MLPSKNRLKSQAEFNRVYGRRMSVAGRSMVVYGAPGNINGGSWKLGMSVSKKIGGAVDRNLVRRRLSEAFAGESKILPPAYEAVIVARKPITEQNFHNMEEELASLLKELSEKERQRAER